MILQIKEISKTNNLSLKYKVWEWKTLLSKMKKEKNSVFLEKKGKKFYKIDGDLSLSKHGFLMLLNDFFNNYQKGKHLINENQLILTKQKN